MMETVVLNNGVQMPAAGFGVFQIADEAQCIQTVCHAIEAGYRLIDTAQSYGNEIAVGKAIRTSTVPRHELYITTKVWISNAREKKTYSSVIESMEKMQLDYLDLVLIHQPLNDYYGSYRALTQLYKQRKIRAIGVSNFYPDRLADLALFNEVTPAVNQIEVNPFHQQIEAQKLNEKYHVQLEAWAPFAEGRNGMFTNPLLTKIGQRYGKSVGQVILRWLIQRGIVPLSKTVRKERMQENLNIFDFSLTSEEMQLIASMDRQESSFFDHRQAASVEMLAGLVR